MTEEPLPQTTGDVELAFDHRTESTLIKRGLTRLAQTRPPELRTIEPGTVLWRFEEFFDGTSTIMNGVAYLLGYVYYERKDGLFVSGSEEHRLSALDVKTGMVLWSRTIDNNVSDSICYGGRIFLSGYDRVLRVLDASSGQELAQLQMPDDEGMGWSAEPCIAEGRIFVAGETLDAYDLESYQLLWSFKAPSIFAAPSFFDHSERMRDDALCTPVVANGLVHTARIDFDHWNHRGLLGELFTLDAYTGTEVWRREITEAPSLPAIASCGLVVVRSQDPTRSFVGHDLEAFRASDGSPMWRFGPGTPSARFAPPIAADGMLFARRADGYIYALECDTGQEKWRFDGRTSEGESVGVSDPTSKDGVVYVGNREGTLSAVNAANGQLLWNAAILDSESRFVIGVSHVIVGDGVVVVVSDCGPVYGFRA